MSALYCMACGREWGIDPPCNCYPETDEECVAREARGEPPLELSEGGPFCHFCGVEHGKRGEACPIGMRPGGPHAGQAVLADGGSDDLPWHGGGGFGDPEPLDWKK